MALIRLKAPQIYSSTLKNAQGEPLPVPLTKAEAYHAQYMQRKVNERFDNVIGYEVQITTLTQVVKKVSEAKYYEIAPADYCPIKMGQGTFMSNLTTFRSFDITSPFEDGIINTGTPNARQAQSNTAIDAVNIKINNWNKGHGWTIFDLEEASRSGNWDLIAALEESRKRNWDLGIQRVVFLGANGLNGTGGSCLGILNQPGITFNTTLLTQKLSTLTPTQLSQFLANVLQAYRANCNYTAYPTHLVIPESDYNGLGVQSSPTFPMKSILQVITETLQVMTQNPNFKIRPLIYCDVANGQGVLPSQAATCMYALYNYDEKSLRADIPLQYTNTLANSLDNFMFQNTGYGQFTGAMAIRPAELLYFGF